MASAKKIAALMYQARAAKWTSRSIFLEATLKELALVSSVDGYAVQKEMLLLHQSEHIGWKVGATSHTSQKQLQLEAPFRAPLFRPWLLQPEGPQEEAVGVSLRRLGATGITCETELGFRLRRDLKHPENDSEFSYSQVHAALGSAFSSVEVTGRRCGGGPMPDILLADSGGCGAVVRGRREVQCNEWCASDVSSELFSIKRATSSVELNSEHVASGAATQVLGDPINSVVWLANHLLDDGLHLKANDIVITGTMHGKTEVKSGDIVKVDFGSHLDALTINFTD